MGIFDFIMGRNNSGPVKSRAGVGNSAAESDVKKIMAEVQSLKEKYDEAFVQYTNYFDSMRHVAGVTEDDPNRQKFLDELVKRMPKFKNEQMLSYVKHVFVSIDHFGMTNEALNQMESGLRNPSHTTIKRFDEHKRRHTNLIKNNIMISNRVYFFNSISFQKTIRKIEPSGAVARLFNVYCGLSQLEVDYFQALCRLRDADEKLQKSYYTNRQPYPSK
ncbi:MAG: hypothetical protein ACP5NW_00395 [Candidatus Woesearchaeota archaeon]